LLQGRLNKAGNFVVEATRAQRLPGGTLARNHYPPIYSLVQRPLGYGDPY